MAANFSNHFLRRTLNLNLISVFGLTSLMDSYVSLTRPFVSQRTISTRHRWKTAGRSTCHRFMSSSSSSRKERKRQEEQETKLFVRPSPLQIRNKNGRSICLPSSTRRGKWFFKDENKKKKKKRALHCPSSRRKSLGSDLSTTRSPSNLTGKT